ncbi:MAG: hypothetical protein E6I88_03135 [Chloroflexi bacterium]|nr:MAG: hypothetical protein E6I88_03135 [Chloroflexota bacterium]TME45465.1 MAG: hypothetical protein E6I56_09240 [Chloroflexota bacterium]
MRACVRRVASREDRLFIGLAAEQRRDASQCTLVGGGVNDMVFGEQRIERLAEGGTKVERGNREWPTTQWMAVVIDGLDRRPFAEQ